MPQTLSVVLATYNEESNLPTCLKSIKNLADEIVVVDGSSEDRTRDIAKSFNARVFKVKNLPMFHTNKQLAIDKATKDWILQLDADEVVSQELKKEIQAIINNSSSANAYPERASSAYYLPRKNFFLGCWLKKGGQYPDEVIRLFKKGTAKFPQKNVHEQLQVKGPVGHLKGHLLHYTAPTFSRYLTNSNRYTSLTAKDLKRQKVKLTPFNLLNYCLVKPLVTFANIYFRHKGFVDGLPGFIFALFSGLHWPIAYFKYWEKHESRS